METMQRRSFNSDFKTRAEENGDIFISGYFSVFNSEYELFPGGVEVIAPGAFDGALSDDIRALINHDSTLVLGRTKAGTLMLSVDEKGLFGEIKINQKDQDALNLYERVKRGDVSQCSFGFDILDEEKEDNGNGIKWIIKRVKLYEVSVVTFPAYEETSVTARANEFKEAKKRKTELFKEKLIKRLKGEKENA